MKLDSTLQNHFKVNSSTFELFWKVSRFAKDLYNRALYIQRQYFFNTGTTLSLSALFKEVKITDEYRKLPSDLAQQVLIRINQALKSFFTLLKKKRKGTYNSKVRLPYYLDHDDHFLLTFISRQLKQENRSLRLSLGRRGLKSTGTRFIYLSQPPLGIEPKQIRIVPRFKAMYFDIEYIYEIESIPRQQAAVPDSSLSIDLGLDNFATCVTTTETAFIIEGRGIKSFNRWWNKRRAKYQSRINKQGIRGVTRRMARMQRYRRNVINNYLNHVVRYLIDYCLQHRIETIVVGEWGDMKRGLKMPKKVSALFQTLPYGWFKQKLTETAVQGERAPDQMYSAERELHLTGLL